jgi:quinol monooxygenase YgiN
MIHVIAGIELRPGTREQFLALFRANIPNVLAEEGCLRYEPTVDVEAGIAAQGGVRPNVVTIVEAWESVAHLKAHLAAPHMAAYREQVKDLVAGVRLQVVTPA